MIWIINGTVYTMSDAGIIENGCLGIEDRKITYVGQYLEPPLDAEIIDANGGIIMPGIIEAHCHIGISEEKKGMEGDDCNECTDLVTPYLRAIDGINPLDPAFHMAIQAGITSVMVGPGSANVVGGQFVFMKTHGRCMDDMIVKNPAAMKVAFGENPKREYGAQNTMPSTRMGTAALLREQLWKAKQYRDNKIRMEKQKEQDGQEGHEECRDSNNALEFHEDFRMEPWIQVLDRKIPMKAHAHRTDDILTAIRIAKEFEVDLTIDHCTEGHLIAEEIRKSGYPAICGPHLANRNKLEIQNADFKTPGILSKAGGLVSLTTDHPVSLIQHLPICAAMAVKKGMEPMEALSAITIHASQICRVDDRVGSLEEGKDADIVIFDGSPLEIATETLYTVIDGSIVYRKSDDKVESYNRVC